MCTHDRNSCYEPNPKIMKTYKNQLFTLLVAAGFLFSFTACEDQSNSMSEKEMDAELASQIIAQSLADDTDGLMANIYDASSTVSDNGMETGGAFTRNRSMMKSASGDVIAQGPNGPHYGHGNPNSGRGGERNFNHTYNPETGEHHVTFERNLERDRFSKSMTGDLTYIYTDTEGTFVVRPRANRDSIANISYVGKREGFHEGPVRSSTFSRTDSLNFSGIDSTSTDIVVNGTHLGNGENTVTLSDGTIHEASHSVYFSFTDLSLAKSIFRENEGIENGVTGTFEYDLEVTKDGETSVAEGTIEFTGDGTALLDFKNLPDLFRIALKDGKVERRGRR